MRARRAPHYKHRLRVGETKSALWLAARPGGKNLPHNKKEKHPTKRKRSSHQAETTRILPFTPNIAIYIIDGHNSQEKVRSSLPWRVTSGASPYWRVHTNLASSMAASAMAAGDVSWHTMPIQLSAPASCCKSSGKWRAPKEGWCKSHAFCHGGVIMCWTGVFGGGRGVWGGIRARWLARGKRGDRKKQVHGKDTCCSASLVAEKYICCRPGCNCRSSCLDGEQQRQQVKIRRARVVTILVGIDSKPRRSKSISYFAATIGGVPALLYTTPATWGTEVCGLFARRMLHKHHGFYHRGGATVTCSAR